MPRAIITIEGNINGPNMNGPPLNDTDLLGNSFRKKYAARANANQHNIGNPLIAFENFVGNSRQGTFDPSAIHEYGLFSSHFPTSTSKKKSLPAPSGKTLPI